MTSNPKSCDQKIDTANAALQQGGSICTEQLYREVIQEEPDNVRALDGLGVLLCQKGETEQGIPLFTQALQVLRRQLPLNLRWEASILFHLGLSYRSQGLQQEALRYFTESAAVPVPHEFDLILNLGQIHFDAGQYEKAATYFKELVQIKPDDVSTLLTLGYTLSMLERYEEAVDVLRKADTLDHASPEICFYLAESLRREECFAESLTYYQRMLLVGKEYPQAIHGYGKSLLALGNLENGWEAMEFRLISSVGTWCRHSLTNWTPDRKSGSKKEHVLAYSEEGIGAELMFASCLPDLIQSVGHCVVECESSLHTLFRRSFPHAEFVQLADDLVSPESNPWGISLDSQIAFGSLPRYFRRSINNFPLRKSYLIPNQELVTQWSTRLAGLGDAKKVGILWKGTWTDETPKQTTLPLQELYRLMNVHSEAAWISLQHGSYQSDMRQQRGICPRIFPEVFRYDMDQMAALIAALDLVITPPGYVAHLAGALGVRTWLLLSSGADWRHTIDAGRHVRSVWHPTIKIYRQTKNQTQQQFFSVIDKDLGVFLQTRRPPEEIPVILNFTEQKTITLPTLSRPRAA